MGPIMMDVQSTSLNEEDREILQHPLVGGLILFTRNYENPEQLCQLTRSVREAAGRDILIAVDHEGGRVQRFREGFSSIPAMGTILKSAEGNIQEACIQAKKAAQLMALEVQAAGIDISFAPVIDIDNISEVIKDRGFDKDPENVSLLASAFIEGMNSVGMKATGKHFPGHGSVVADSHIDLPIDSRPYSEISGLDMIPFKRLIKENKLDAIMPAHVIYPAVDDRSVGFSELWLQDLLRLQLGFKGTIFSDDLSMEAASSIGGYIERAEAAQAAGCDMLLVCNKRSAQIEVIDRANISVNEHSSKRIANMLKTNDIAWHNLSSNDLWRSLTQ